MSSRAKEAPISISANTKSEKTVQQQQKTRLPKTHSIRAIKYGYLPSASYKYIDNDGGGAKNCAYFITMRYLIFRLMPYTPWARIKAAPVTMRPSKKCNLGSNTRLFAPNTRAMNALNIRELSWLGAWLGAKTSEYMGDVDGI